MFMFWEKRKYDFHCSPMLSKREDILCNKQATNCFFVITAGKRIITSSIESQPKKVVVVVVIIIVGLVVVGVVGVVIIET